LEIEDTAFRDRGLEKHAERGGGRERDAKKREDEERRWMVMNRWRYMRINYPMRCLQAPDPRHSAHLNNPCRSDV